MQKDIIWAAGLIDGEGYIGVRKRTRDSGINDYSIRLAVGMCHKPTLDKLKSIFKIGSRVHMTRMTPSNPRYNDPKIKQRYVWNVDAHDAYKVMSLIIPYLVTKKEQVKYCLEFWSRRVIHHSSEIIPTYELAEREFFFNFLKALKHRRDEP